jgi:hypothetical protein
MSTSLVHILTIVGNGAGEAEAACEELLGRQVERHPKRYGSDDWSERDHEDIAAFCQTLVRVARELPVVYYAQYLDGWSVANSMFRLLQCPDGKRRWVCGDQFSFVFYPSIFSQYFLSAIKRMRRTKMYRTQAEDRWYLDRVSEATESALWLRAQFLVVSVSECIGGSRLDEDLKAALETPIALGQRRI